MRVESFKGKILQPHFYIQNDSFVPEQQQWYPEKLCNQKSTLYE